MAIYKRFVYRPKTNDFEEPVFEAKENISTNWKKTTLLGIEYEYYNNIKQYTLNNAEANEIYLTFDKPKYSEVRIASPRSTKTLYSTYIIYLKVRDKQSIVNLNTFTEEDNLDKGKGLNNNLEIYFTFEPNKIIFAVESQHQSIPTSKVRNLLKTIAHVFFDTDLKKKDLEIVSDFTKKQFKREFDSSTGQKSFEIYHDVTKRDQLKINQDKRVFSLKKDFKFKDLNAIINNKNFMGDNIKKVVVRCENELGKRISIKSEDTSEIMQHASWDIAANIEIKDDLSSTEKNEEIMRFLIE